MPDRKTHPLFEGKTVRQIETILIARRVDRIINEHMERPEAVRNANALRTALTLQPRKLRL